MTDTASVSRHPPIRIVTATSLFDGHDVAVNIMRRILQDAGVEVVHLGHNRSVREIVTAAIEEDAQGIAVSSYQGGHMEYFKYMVDLVREESNSSIKIFGGGGGVIVPKEIKVLEAYGVEKIYSPEDGAKWGLRGMIDHMIERLDFPTVSVNGLELEKLDVNSRREIAKFITAAELSTGVDTDELNTLFQRIHAKSVTMKTPVVGVTGTGGAGKSSLTDEMLIRLLMDSKGIQIAVICADPSRRKTGGALLGDRIRMNALNSPRVFTRSLATRESESELPSSMARIVDVVKAAGFDLIFVETAGIGQGSSKIYDLCDVSIYVMTSEFGSASQLEKIDMLDYADLVAINKFDKRGSEDAFRDVRKQVQRNLQAFETPLAQMPVFGTIAARFNDDGVTALYHALLDLLAAKSGCRLESGIPRTTEKSSSSSISIIPPERTRYLSDIADTVRRYHERTNQQSEKLRQVWHLRETEAMVSPGRSDTGGTIRDLIKQSEASLDPETISTLDNWEETKKKYKENELIFSVRGRDFRRALFVQSLSNLKIPRVALPGFTDPGELFRWLREENLPGYFPFTAGAFPLKRPDEDPIRMFAGEGDPERTNIRFKLLSADSSAKRLSTAFDSVTLYGQDPGISPDVYGKIGTSGVSVCSLDDMRVLYRGFDLCAPDTSVSMTINGPAPIVLAMFFNAAIEQQVEKYTSEKGRQPAAGELPAIKAAVLSTIRGTVQADILKEDQGQNTCVFSIGFALKMMGDIQAYFIANRIRNFYSVSVSGYHIAEAGANPITQLAFTLANGFTYLEYYLSRGMPLDEFAPNLSFFFSNGMDPEYTVIGRVARRIWAIALREKYKGSKRSQILKYHIQTSGRSLHSQEIQFNDIRTTLQALCAIYDNCASLHTNAYDEAITTPSNESVRRAQAIQMIINREWGLAKNENVSQGSFIVEELTRLVEEAVLSEFDRITRRGGVLGAMETGYQRSRIQEESMTYEQKKHSGELPIVGVNTFTNPDASLERTASGMALSRATEGQKKSQIERLTQFKQRNAGESPKALERLKQTALSGGNIFEELMDTVRYCSLGQITRALSEVGGQYRRNM